MEHSINFISAVLRAISIGLLGYYSGHTVEIIIGDVKKIEIVLSAIVCMVFIMVVIKKIITKRDLNIIYLKSK